jgi:hypothetical protein
MSLFLHAWREVRLSYQTIQSGISRRFGDPIHRYLQISIPLEDQEAGPAPASQPAYTMFSEVTPPGRCSWVHEGRESFD